MVPDISQIGSIKQYTIKTSEDRTIYFKDEKAFLVVNKNTIEIRCDDKLSRHLQEQFESVMESRYFGRGGIEIVLANQLSSEEIKDLIRLSYDMTE